MNEDLGGVERAAASDGMAVCDICGATVSHVASVRLAGQRGMSEPSEAIQVCEACGARIVEDGVPFEMEVAAGLQAADN